MNSSFTKQRESVQKLFKLLRLQWKYIEEKLKLSFKKKNSQIEHW